MLLLRQDGRSLPMSNWPMKIVCFLDVHGSLQRQLRHARRCISCAPRTCTRLNGEELLAASKIPDGLNIH
jgi:hypothetical protein